MRSPSRRRNPGSFEPSRSSREMTGVRFLQARKDSHRRTLPISVGPKEIIYPKLQTKVDVLEECIPRVNRFCSNRDREFVLLNHFPVSHLSLTTRNGTPGVWAAAVGEPGPVVRMSRVELKFSSESFS